MKTKTKFYNSYSGTHGLIGHDENLIMRDMDWSKTYFMTNIIEHVPQNKDAKILDLGCGYGKSLIALRERGYTNYFGVDISEQQIAWAKGLFLIENCDKIDAAKYLEDKNLTYDCILAIDIFEHLDLDELVDICSKTYKSLKVNGRLIIQVPNGLSLLNPIIYGDITHVRAFTVESMKQLLMAFNFSKKVKFYEVWPDSSFKGKTKKIICKLFVYPVLRILVFILHKDVRPSIFTPNLLVVAEKSNFKN